MYAVIQLKGHQYIIQKGTTLEVDNIDEGEKLDLDTNVLAIFDEEGKQVKVGMPTIKGVHVEYEVGESFKGEKVNVLKFKRKNRYERNIGFRKHLTHLHIKDISVNG